MGTFGDTPLNPNRLKAGVLVEMHLYHLAHKEGQNGNAE